MAPGVGGISPAVDTQEVWTYMCFFLCRAPSHRGGTGWGSSDLIIVPWVQSGATYITWRREVSRECAEQLALALDWGPGIKVSGVNLINSSAPTSCWCPANRDLTESRRSLLSLPLSLPPHPSFPPSLDPWMSFLSTLSSGTWPPPQFLWAVSVLSLYRTGALAGVPWGCMGACLSASQPSRKGRPCWEVSRECCDFHLPEESLLLIPERTCRGEGAIISFQVGEPG